MSDALATPQDLPAIARLLGRRADSQVLGAAVLAPHQRLLVARDADGAVSGAVLVLREHHDDGDVAVVRAAGGDQAATHAALVAEARRWGCAAIDAGGAVDPLPEPPAEAPLTERFLAAAARAASDAMAIAGRLSGPEHVARKADGSPRVAADEAIDRAASHRLAALGLPLLSEERADPTDGDSPGAWAVVDPIDGTGNFLAGLSPYAFSAGLVGTDGSALAGYVADLSSGRRWYGAAGSGAFRDGVPIRPRHGGTAMVPTPPPGAVAQVPEGFRRLRITGCTAADLCAVADGSAGAWHDLDRDGTHVHDVAGALGVVAAAGAAIIDPDGAPLALRPDTTTLIRFVVAATGEAAEALRLAVTP